MRHAHSPLERKGGEFVMRLNQRGQVTAEMAVLFAFVIAGFIAAGFYLQRGIQGSTKSNADSVGSQFSTASGYASYSASNTHEKTATPTKTTSCSQSKHTPGTAVSPGLLTDCAGRTLHNATTAVLDP